MPARIAGSDCLARSPRSGIIPRVARDNYIEKPARPRPIQAHVMALVGLRGREAIYRALSNPQACVRQRQYRRDREAQFQCVLPALRGDGTDRLCGKAETVRIFHWFNFARYRLMQTTDEVVRGRPVGVKLARELARWALLSEECRSHIVQCNMGLCHAVAKRTINIGGVQDYEDVVCEGTIGLVMAINRFDVARGWQFAGYAYPSIMHFVIKHRTLNRRYAVNHSMRHDEDRDADPDSDFIDGLRAVLDLRAVLASDMIGLTRQERRVIARRFSLDGSNGDSSSINAIAQALQIPHSTAHKAYHAGLAKLRAALDPDVTPEKVGSCARARSPKARPGHRRAAAI